MLVLWLALNPTLAVETIPTEELTDYLTAVRTASEVDKLAIGFPGYENEDRLAPIVDPLDFVVSKRLPANAVADTHMKGVLKKAKTHCGFMISGGGRTVTLHMVGECADAVSEDEKWIAECRDAGLESTYPEGPAERIELLRPPLPEGLDKDAWAVTTAHLATGFAACASSTDEGLGEESRLTVKLAWDAAGNTQLAQLTMGGAPDHLRTCAIRVGSCLPDIAEGEADRSINQVIRVVDPTDEAPAAEDTPKGETTDGDAPDDAPAEGDE